MSKVNAKHAAPLAAALKAAPSVASPGWMKVVQIAIYIVSALSKVKRAWARFRENLSVDERARVTELMLRTKDRDHPISRDEQRELVRLVCKGLGLNWGDDGVGVPAVA